MSERVPTDMQQPDELNTAETNPSEPLILTELWTYPIKSAGGVRLQRSAVEMRGLEHDRRWMLVDASGKLLTQRRHPRMRLIELEILPPDFSDVLCIRAPGMPPLRVPRVAQGALVHTQVWKDTTSGHRVSGAASEWFSTFLGVACELLHMPDDDTRAQRGKPFSSLLSFADGNPFHLVTQASVADLNARLARPVLACDFRPNLVVSGGLPYAEDYWRFIQIGPLRFQVVESCARCCVPNVNDEAQMTAEPLRTLASYRRRGQAVQFGQHLLQGESLFGPGGVLAVGMPVVILERADSRNPSYA